MAERTQETLTTVSIATTTDAQRQRPPATETRETFADAFALSVTTAVGRPFEPFLTINGVTFPVKLAAPSYQEEFIGQQTRTYNGRLRNGVRRRRRVFRVETPLIPLADGYELMRVLHSPPPLQVTTFMFGTDEAVPCFIGPINGGYHRGGEIGAGEGRDFQLQSLIFDIIPE